MPMPDLFLIFNHEITPLQEEDARRSVDVTRIIDLPSDLKTLWSQIPPDLPRICCYLEPVMDWLVSHARENDFVLIQGDFGACFIMVNFAFNRELILVYSTTWSEAVEEHEDDGTIKMVHQFKHRIFRRYGV